MLPIFRSEEQSRLLAEIFVHAAEPMSLTGLSDRTGVSIAGVHKEVERLEAAGLIQSRRVGRTRLIEPDEASPYYPDLRGLLAKAFGPEQFLRRGLDGLAGVEEAFIFGSWAAPEIQRPPEDIDVMVIGTPDVDAVHALARAIESEVGRAVNVVVMTRDEFMGDDGFLRSVRNGPTVSIT